jgi:hypothetical protein
MQRVEKTLVSVEIALVRLDTTLVRFEVTLVSVVLPLVRSEITPFVYKSHFSRINHTHACGIAASQNLI